ncbi:MAG: dipicolinate synthase subunit B [Patescibacteria group bacterium]
MSLAGIRLGFAMTGSHCTIPGVWSALEAILAAGADVYPILSRSVDETDTRFGKASEIRERLAALCGREPWSSQVSVEAIGPKSLLDVLAVAPCTGNTLAKLAHGISDTVVTLACKAQHRNQRPIVLAVSTNDGLSGNAVSLGILLNRKCYYFVPFGQDNPEGKTNSLLARMDLLPDAIEAALAGRQLEPLLIEHPV